AWRTQTGGWILTLRVDREPVWSGAFRPDGRRLATGSGVWAAATGRGAPGDLKVWDIETGQVVRTIKGHHEVVHSVAFSPDGGRIAAGSRGNIVRVQDV